MVISWLIIWRLGIQTHTAHKTFPLDSEQILIQSVCETMVPKLVAEDIPLLFSLLSDVFPGIQYTQAEMKALRQELEKVCNEMYLTYGEGEDSGAPWVEKVGALLFWVVCSVVHSLIKMFTISLD